MAAQVKLQPKTSNRPFLVSTRKGVDLRCLDRKPQGSLSIIHRLMSAKLQELMTLLLDLENNYLAGRTPLEELRRWVKPLNNITRHPKIIALVSLVQIDEVGRQSNSGFKDIDPGDLAILKEVTMKVKEYVPCFTDIISDVKLVVAYMTKYCLSFYTAEDETVDLDTSKHYEQKRHQVIRQVSEFLNNIESIWQKFQKQGYYYNDLSNDGKDLCRKARILNAPFVMIFYEVCGSMREAVGLVWQWLEADTNYAGYLHNDVEQLEQECDTLKRQLREYQHKYHQLMFRWKSMQSEHEGTATEMRRLQGTEDHLVVEEEMLLTEANEMQVEIEMKEYSRDELIKKAASTEPAVLYEKYSQFSERLRELRAKLPGTKRRLASTQSKLAWLKEKQATETRIANELAQVKQEVTQLEHLKSEHEIELTLILKRLELAKRIYLYKTSSDAIAKIFYKQPVEANSARLPGVKGKQDPFEHGCSVVAMLIYMDWPRLYRHLPFTPARGVRTIDEDIAELTQMVSRIGVEQTALRSLERWRRNHSRAKLDDVRRALLKIKRRDIVKAMEEELNPTPVKPPTPDDVYSYVDADLIPFLKQVERFDELRAANRI